MKQQIRLRIAAELNRARWYFYAMPVDPRFDALEEAVALLAGLEWARGADGGEWVVKKDTDDGTQSS